MILDINDIDEFVVTNNIKEVTSANIISMHSTEPDPEGLGSYEIFGKPGTYERKNTFAYIDLGDMFIHPHVFYVMTSLKKIIHDVVYGNGDFYIKNGSIFKLGENMNAPIGAPTGTGVKFLYNNWNKISFSKEKMSPIVKDRVIFLEKLKKSEIFITKFLVIPPFYRDIDINSGKKNEINIFYQRLISLSSMIKNASSLFTIQSVSDAHRKVQDTLQEIYNYFITFTSGTKGFIHQHVMGKATDFSARLVISTPHINANVPEDMEVSFTHSAIPLHVVIKCFAPYIVHEFKRFIADKVRGVHFVYDYTKKEPERIELAEHYEEEFMTDNIYKLIDLYYDSKEFRLEFFTLLAADGSRIPVIYTSSDKIISSAEKVSHNIIHRPITFCELFYILAMNSVKDNYVYVTRYPVEDYHNIYPTKMNIIPYYKYKPAVIDMIDYPRFPIINLKEDKNKIDTLFTDTLRVFPTYLSALGADYDGDMVSVQGIFGNKDADEYILSKKNIVNIAGNTVRTTKEVTAHTLFALTRTEPII